MLGLFAQSMFVATRLSPLANTAAAKDWRLTPGPVGEERPSKRRKDRKNKQMVHDHRKLAEFFLGRIARLRRVYRRRIWAIGTALDRR